MQKMMIHYNDVPIYPIVLSENFDALGEALDDLMIKDRKVCIVTDSHVADFYLEQVEHIVKEHCAAASHFIFPAGEESKTLTTVENLYEFLIQNKFERKDMLVALGGGVFANVILQERCRQLLEKDGFTVYVNEQVPGNDGGIALGQAWLASLTMKQ